MLLLSSQNKEFSNDISSGNHNERMKKNNTFLLMELKQKMLREKS